MPAHAIEPTTSAPRTSIADSLRAALCSHFRAPVRLEPVSLHSSGIVFKASVKTDPQLRLAVKYCRRPHSSEPDADFAQSQFGALQRAQAAFGDMQAPYKVPRPYALDTLPGAFAMSWIEGESLTRRMSRGLARSRIAADFFRAGAWLGRFHAVGPLRAGSFDFAERAGHLAEMIAGPLADPAFESGARLLLEGGAKAEGEPVHISWLHGDCKSDNILLSGGETYGIDVNLAHENSVEHDLAQFLNHLDLVLLDPSCLHRAGSRVVFENAFLDGYRSAGPSVSALCLGWVRLWALLNLWRSSLDACRGSKLQAWLVNRNCSRLCARLTRELADVEWNGRTR